MKVPGGGIYDRLGCGVAVFHCLRLHANCCNAFVPDRSVIWPQAFMATVFKGNIGLDYSMMLI